MQLSKEDRAALVTRVEQRLVARGVSRASIEAAIDQVATRLALPDESPPAEHVVFAVGAESMPDLASRFRQALSSDGIAATESGVATAGRHTVVTVRAPASARGAIEAAAARLGARVIDVDAPGGAGR
jgi:hypothetical protein